VGSIFGVGLVFILRIDDTLRQGLEDVLVWIKTLEEINSCVVKVISLFFPSLLSLAKRDAYDGRSCVITG
jgi:hypothetical protein